MPIAAIIYLANRLKQKGYKMGEKLTELELEQMYDEMLDSYGNHEGKISVAGREWPVSYILSQVDPIDYKTSMHNYADGLLRDGYEIEGY